MQNRWLLVAVTIAVGWAVACGGSSNSPAGPSGGGSGSSAKCTAGNLGSGVVVAHGTMSAQIDGGAWTADCIGAVVKQLSQSVQSLQIVGADYNNDKTRVLGIDVKTGVGTTKIGGLSLLVVALSDAWIGDAKSWSSVGQSSGSVTITAESNNSATGTFTFTLPPITVSGASSDATITNGAFNITF